MGNIYEFLKARMESVDRNYFSRSHGMKMVYEFTPELSNCPELEEYVKDEKNSILKAVMKKPVIYVEVEQIGENGRYSMAWNIGFEGMEFREFCFSIEEEFHNNDEIESVAMWMTLNNEDGNLCWQGAVGKLYEIYAGEQEEGWEFPFMEEDEYFEDDDSEGEDSESNGKVIMGVF